MPMPYPFLGHPQLKASAWRGESQDCHCPNHFFVGGNMKKRQSVIILSLLVLMLSLTACQFSKTAKELRIDDHPLTLEVNETKDVLLTILPVDAARPSVQWSSSDSTIASVDPEKGTVTGLSAGNVTITVRTGNGRLSAAYDIEVRPKPVTSLRFDEKEISLIIGSSGKLSITVEPSDATDQTLEWHSSDAAVARVDSSGTVSALAVGSAVISASTKDGKVSETALIEVKPKAVTGIVFRQKTLTLESGMTESVGAAVEPSDATDQTLEWQTSSSKIAKVDGKGNVTALAAGTAVITATTTDGKVSFEPSDASPPDLVWSSGDEKVATVDPSGKVTGVAMGKTTVSARTRDGKLSAAATVSVVQGRVNGITLDRKSLVMPYGATEKLVATLNPADAANQSVRWDSSNYLVASVDEMGNVKAKAIGTTVITAKSNDGGYTAKCTVTVAMKDARTGELLYGPDKVMMFSSQSGGYKKFNIYTSPYQTSPVMPSGESWNLEIFRDNGTIWINRIDFSMLDPIMEEPVRITVISKDTGKVLYDYNPLGWTNQ